MFLQPLTDDFLSFTFLCNWSLLESKENSFTKRGKTVIVFLSPHAHQPIGQLIKLGYQI